MERANVRLYISISVDDLSCLTDTLLLTSNYNKSVGLLLGRAELWRTHPIRIDTNCTPINRTSTSCNLASFNTVFL